MIKSLKSCMCIVHICITRWLHVKKKKQVSDIINLKRGILMDTKLDKAAKDYLLNPENEIISEFKSKAPGTFKHCEEVANICEKIGRELCLDTEFLKIIGLYHDVGKMLSSQYYSENQPKGYNVHDNMQPEVSAHFIISHVSNSIGILATRVPNISVSILKCISQHHGNSVLKMFLNKLGTEEEKASRINEFRYPYEKPNNVYSCILMIVDIVESKIRSMKSSNPDVDVSSVIRETMEQLTMETNLDELTIKQGRTITEILMSEYNASDHKRVPYEVTMPV